MGEKRGRKSGMSEKYDWIVHPKGEQLLVSEVSWFLRHNVFARGLTRRMLKETSTELYDWIDHMVIPSSRLSVYELRSHGFVEDTTARTREGVTVFRHPGTVFFPVLLDSVERYELVIKPEHLDACVAALGKHGEIAGPALAPVRKAVLNVQGRYVLSAIERRGSQDFIVSESVPDKTAYSKALATFKHRKRLFRSDGEGMERTKTLIRSVMKDLSPSRTADAFFRAEREYWMKRNKAGQIQYKRQQVLGLGWGNHDHHTYRSSREYFRDLIALFELMGYHCREQFYAGEKAGWGAQILEHPACDIVIFADVDITHSEKEKDFAHRGLKHARELGTVGLWIGLHGESVLQSGMHHLEARFNFKRLQKDLKRNGIQTMPPFSNFPFLKQAFTFGERWKVDSKRVKRLLLDGSITNEQYSGFIARGAIGSHMENLQRRQGYKGFNQDSVSAIIKATNPLKRLLQTDTHHKGA